MTEILRYAAFTTDPAGGNPAGVVPDAHDLSDARMQEIAAEVGYSETAFLVAEEGSALRLRYFSPRAEVEFCGHATIATAVVLAERRGPGLLDVRINAGEVPVDVERTPEGLRARLTSVPTSSAPADPSAVDEALGHLGWARADLGELPPHVAFAGNHHLILHAATRERLADLDYDVPGLTDLMTREGWTTVDLVHPERPDLWHARNPFPIAGVYEDPATGAAAAALGGYLRALGRVPTPRELAVHQGDDMGRPSRLLVTVGPDDARVGVAGSAVPIG